MPPSATPPDGPKQRRPKGMPSAAELGRMMRSDKGLELTALAPITVYSRKVAVGRMDFDEAVELVVDELMHQQDWGLPFDPVHKAVMRDREPVPEDRIREWVSERFDAAVRGLWAAGEAAVERDTDVAPTVREERSAMPDKSRTPVPPQAVPGRPAAPPVHPPPAPAAAPPPDPRRVLTEALALEGVRLGKEPREAVALAKTSVAGMDEAAVRGTLASLKDRKWALREDGTLAPDPVPGAAPRASREASIAGIPPPGTLADPMCGLLASMKREADGFRGAHPDLAEVVDLLAQRAARTAGALAHQGFRTRVAWAAQDVEKLAGRALPMPEPLRAEVAALSATAPGLENGRMRALLAQTPSIQDAGLVAAIRRAASDLAKEPGEVQRGEQAAERIDALERRLHVRDPAPSAALVKPAVEAASPGPGPQRPRPETVPPAPPLRRESPPVPRQAPSAQQSPGFAPPSQPGSVASGILGAMRVPLPAGPPPWQTVTPGLGERLTAFEVRMQEGRSARLMAESWEAGEAAMAAVERFAAGQGKSLLGRIAAAGGAEAIPEMVPGGEHAALRAEFDRAMAEDPRFAAAYREARAALEAYGEARLAAGEDAAARGLPAERLAALERMDAVLGEQAARIPGEKPGNSILSEVGEKVAEVLREAAEKAAAAVASAAAGAKARFSVSAGPSPAP